MSRFAQTFTKTFLKNDEGVTAIEYCMAAACLAGTIVFGISNITPSITHHLGNSMKPNAGVLHPYDCKANGGSGNCGVGKGNGGGNGTGNEGNGVGPGNNNGNGVGNEA